MSKSRQMNERRGSEEVNAVGGGSESTVERRFISFSATSCKIAPSCWYANIGMGPSIVSCSAASPTVLVVTKHTQGARLPAWQQRLVDKARMKTMLFLPRRNFQQKA